MKLKKTIKSFLVLTVLALSLAGCTNKENDKKDGQTVEITGIGASNQEDAQEEEKPEQKENLAPDPAMTGKNEGEQRLSEKAPDSGHEFSLNEEEQALYEAFKETKDMTVFKDVNPVSIAKVNIMYGIMGEWESEYSMFYQEEEMEFPTLEDYKAYYVKSSQTTNAEIRQSYANWYFPFIDEAEFTEYDDGTKAKLIFYSVPESDEDTEDDLRVHFFFVKGEDGIWWVKELGLWE